MSRLEWRHVTGALLAVLFSFCIACPESGWAQERKVTLVGTGGETDAAYEKTVLKAFREQSGIKLITDTWSHELAKLRAQVEANNVEWDILVTDADRALLGCEQGFLMPIPKSVLGPAEDYLDGTVLECGAPYDVFGATVVYDEARKWPKWGGKNPAVFADFWDVEKFPGKRGLRKRIKAAAEHALMGDGVPNDKVYEVLKAPGGLERALAKLGSVREHIVFWARPAQATQMLADGEVVMTINNSGRSLAHKQEGRNFQVIWDRMIWSTNTLIIPKGPRTKEALALLEFMQKPEYMAKSAELVYYGPSRKSAIKFVNPAVLPLLTTAPDHMVNALRRDDAFWLDHEADFEKKFSVWLSN